MSDEQISEQVYLDAAWARTRVAFGTEGNVRAAGYVAQLVKTDSFRAAVASAYRAGQAAAPDGPRTWQLPDEPGPEVRRLRPVERYPGDDSIWLDRESDNSGWRIVMRGRASEPMEWVRAYSLGTGTVWGGRPLTDATPADGQDGDGHG